VCCAEENSNAVTTVKQLSLCRWPENKVTTFIQYAEINTAGSTSSG